MLNNLVPHQKLQRANLREQATDLLRDCIVSGLIPPGSKIVEREVAEWLGISRAPARDALMDLEKEGLIVSRPDARYVIEPDEKDIRELHQVRRLLERLAVELAARRTSPDNQAALLSTLATMEQAVQRRDYAAFAKSDVEIHDLIWQQADNRHLQRALRSILGPISVRIASNAERFDWDETLQLHRELVQCINAGDAEAARESLERHIDSSLERSLRFFQTGK
jgi:DNA-binding GntR family transcriptional regulator